MTRIVSIIAVLFYLTVSIGVHVDVDTCCKSIAGLSVFNEKGDHTSELVTDCCAQETMPSCSPENHKGNEGCPSDCVFIQILQQAAPLSLSEAPTALTFLIDKGLRAPSSDIALTDASVDTWTAYTGPPCIAQDEDLYLIQGAHLTYG